MDFFLANGRACLTLSSMPLDIITLIQIKPSKPKTLEISITLNILNSTANVRALRLLYNPIKLNRLSWELLIGECRQLLF
jgi:hypothetical protein